MTTIQSNIEILTSSHTLAADMSIGGKARQLYTLKKMGLPVPNWVVIPHAYFLLNDNQNSTANISQEILSHFGEDTMLAVRSSANMEDGLSHSFAGLFDSVLYVKASDLQAAIHKVFASAPSERVHSYCTHRGLQAEHIQMSVIVQEMLDPIAAGVGFGAHPVSGDTNTKIINATWGVGEGLVSGVLNADSFEIENGVVKTHIATKKFALRYNMNVETMTKQSVKTEQRNIACLEEKHITELVGTLEKLDAHFGKAQDIEFALVDDKIYYLQCRPITQPASAVDTTQTGRRQVWDNSNIVESYPGISSPLTYSFIRRVYEAVYLEFSSLLGVSAKTLEDNAEVYKNMLGYIQGRVYYNLAGWYKALSLLPGYSINAPFMEKMMGVKETFELPVENAQPKKNYIGLVISIFKIIFSFFSLKRSRRKFMALLDGTIRKMDTQDYSTYNANQLLNAYEGLENTLLKKWKAPLVNDFFAMIFYGLLEKLSNKWLKNLRPNFHNELLAGSSDIISVQPIAFLDDIYTRLEDDLVAKQLFLQMSPEQVWEVLQSDKHQAVSQAVQKYIHKFGDRSMGELKLETVTYRQAPETFITFIQNGLRNGYQAQVGGRSNSLKVNAEATLREHLSGLKLWAFNRVLNQARDLISGRENLRFERTRAFGQVRKIFHALGVLWEKNGIIENAKDIFYLTREEINDFIKGMSVNPELKSTIAQRKLDHEKYSQVSSLADRIETFGTVYHNNDFDAPHAVSNTDANTWKGIGASAGVVKANIKIVKDPKEVGSMDGCILVTTCTDPSWVTLFPSAAGILVERGSMLSHSAIVAREMGIPCIVAIDNLLASIEDGALVKMDGSTGQVSIA